jgi:hypothetical protein
MQQTLIFVWQTPEQDQLGMSGSYSFGESHIGLAQASQIPEKVINS